MRRKLIITSLLILALVVVGVVALGFLLAHEPAFYNRAAVPPGHMRTKASKVCNQKLFSLSAKIYDRQDQWQEAFTQLQINSYFAEDFVNSRTAERMLPDGINDLRVAIEDDILRLGFRYGSPPWSMVVSLDVRIWMVRDEANVVAMQFLNLRAGAIPISPKTLMKHLAKILERPGGDQSKIDIDWYRHEGKPVALLRFTGSSRTRPTTQLRLLKVEDQSFTIAGLSVEPSPVFINNKNVTPQKKVEKTLPKQKIDTNTKRKKAKSSQPKPVAQKEKKPKKERPTSPTFPEVQVSPAETKKTQKTSPVAEIPPPAPTVNSPRLGPIIPVEPPKGNGIPPEANP
ncbi:MAG: hypothetical protein ACFCD0_07935 [Gemmataceae bacterium]